MSHDRRIRLGEELGGEYSEIICVIDRSGSMHSIREDAIGGFNVFLEDQKAVPGEAFLTLVQFDHEYVVTIEAMDIKDVPDLTHKTYEPRGSTALLDAIGKAVASTKKLIEGLAENARPKEVIFVIITDGGENASKEYTIDQIKQLVTEQTDIGWNFVFTAANIDAFGTGASIGMLSHLTTAYQATPEGVRGTYSNISHTVSSLRSAPEGADDGECSG